MGSIKPGQTPHYYVPAQSSHPLTASIGALLLGAGAAGWVNAQAWAPFVFFAGLAWFCFILYRWFGDTARESVGGLFSKNVDLSFRWGMGWFIFSEVMFFAAFFGALFYSKTIALDTAGNLINKQYLWTDFKALWPSAGSVVHEFGPANLVEPFTTMDFWPIPLINTLILLTSGVTLTISHHALLDNRKNSSIKWLLATVILGFIFLCLQGYEYYHAYHELNLKLTSGAFGSTFYLLTGFHGFHVFLGATILTVVLLRMMKGHFTPQNHFVFEAGAWYWHFVDVVWLLLFVIVYCM